MRLIGVLLTLVLVAGCSSEAGTPTPAKVGCDGFDKQAVAKALGTTEQVTENATPDGKHCQIFVGAAATSRTGAFISIEPDTEKFGFASWRQTAGARDLSPANGDKAFVAPTRTHEALGGVLHNGTFYRFSVLSIDGDPLKVTTALVDVLEDAL